MNGKSAVLALDLEPAQFEKIGRLSSRIIDAITEGGGNPLPICGGYLDGDCRMLQLFGRVSISSDAFSWASDADLLTLVRMRVRKRAVKPKTPGEDTDEMSCLSAE
jgi:hypothetical protein